MARPWKITPDTKSNSYLIDFSYIDEEGRRCRYRRSAGRGVSKKEAERLAAEQHALLHRDPVTFIRELARPEKPPEPVAFSGLARRWYDLHVRVHLRPTTQRTHEQIVRVHLVPHFGDRDARGITKAEVLDYLGVKRGEGLSPKSINNHLSVLRSVFDFGRDKLELLADNPVEGVSPIRVGQQGNDYLSADESEAFLAAVATRDAEHFALFTTALRAGLRLGEIVELRWRDVDFERGALVVSRSRFREHVGPTKGGRERRVPMSAQLRATLRAHRPEIATPDTLVFPGKDGAALNRDNLKHPHQRAADAIGRSSFRFHDLRHTFASQLTQRGTPLNVVQALLGHADIKTTLRYAHLAPDAMGEWVERLDPERPALRVVAGGGAS